MDKRGSVEILAFILILPLLLIPVFNGFYSFTEIHKHDILKQVTRDALLQMEITGGLKAEDYNKILDFLESKNFERPNIHIDYSPYPVSFGEEVRIKISYYYEKTRLTLVLGVMKKHVTNEVMVYGPVKSTSKYYPR